MQKKILAEPEGVHWNMGIPFTMVQWLGAMVRLWKLDCMNVNNDCSMVKQRRHDDEKRIGTMVKHYVSMEKMRWYDHKIVIAW
jgi:hypothetical protein